MFKAAFLTVVFHLDLMCCVSFYRYSIVQIILRVAHVLDSVEFKWKRVSDDNNNSMFIIICESSNNNDRRWSCEINKFKYMAFILEKSGCVWYEKMEQMVQTKDEINWSSVKIYYYNQILFSFLFFSLWNYLKMILRMNLACIKEI